MNRGAALFLVGSVTLLALAGCGRGWMSFEQRAAWRGEAESACMTAREVQPGNAVERIRAIDGPGVCGAQQPLKVAALGDRTILGYVQEMRPPAGVPGRFPIPEPRAVAPAAANVHGSTDYRRGGYDGRSPGRNDGYGARGVAPPRGPISLYPPGVPEPAEAEPEEEWEEPETSVDERGSPADPYAVPAGRARHPAPTRQQPAARPQALPALGPQRGVLSVGSATVKPAATLACPVVSRLDRWMVATVQPAAQRWFGQPVTEIRQISAYSCRGMNGQAGAPISEHAFGNALDISAFTLADGRRVTVKGGWRGAPEEQGFLRDVHAGACELFSTVLAPGSNRFHYDHIHVDLARRRSGRNVCNPTAVPGELIARRAGGRMGFAPEDHVGGGLSVQLPRAIPGAD